MRTSKISQETARVVALRSTPRRSTRSASRRTSPPHQSPEDIEDVIPPPSKRRRLSAAAERTPTKKSPRSAVKVKTEIEVEEETTTLLTSTSPSRTAARVRRPARKVTNPTTGEEEVEPPADWEEVYQTVKRMRTVGAARNAAVDTMGCERVGEAAATPRDRRYHTLVSLMLSSQTKDTTNARAMARLINELPAHAPGAPPGLTLENVLAVAPDKLNELIWAVGFHNNKTRYLQAAAAVLRDEWAGDVPDTLAGLLALPGVGPKMAYLCLSGAWGRTEGIGVDVHVHRITNLWGWHRTPDPERTRLALQAWLPRALWHDINSLLVGLGQTICLPVGRRCGECELGLRGLCKAADRAKVQAARKLVKTEVDVETELDVGIKDDDGQDGKVKMEDGSKEEPEVAKVEVVKVEQEQEVDEGIVAFPKADSDVYDGGPRGREEPCVS